MKMKIRLIMLLILLLPCIPMRNVQANENSKSVEVSYSPSKDALKKISMRVEIIGNGSISDESEMIVGSSIVYELNFEDTKVFTLLPDAGNHIERIEYDGEDITSSIINKTKVKVICKDHDTVLKIIYDKDKKLDSSVQTGDGTNVVIWSIIGSISFAILYFIMQKRRALSGK